MKLVPLRYLSRVPITNGLGLAGANDNPEWPRYIRTTDIAGPTSLRDDVFASQPPEVAAAAMVAPGDILMTAAGSIGKSVTFSETYPACYAGFLVRVRPHSETEGRFLGYWMQSTHYWDQIRSGAVKSTIENFSAGRYRTLLVPQPELSHQRAIVDHLDRATAMIDAMIGEQDSLVRVLSERRSAVIADAVFRGLGGTSVRAPSVPWLPQIAAHWPTLQLGFVTHTLAGWAFPSEGFTSDTSATRLLRGVNIKPGRTDWSDVVYWDESVISVAPELRLAVGDLVLGMDRPFVRGGVRVAAISDSDLPALLLQRVMRIGPTSRTDRRYLRYLFETSAFSYYLQPLFTGVSVPHISEWQVRKFVMPCPPVDEQREIANHLDGETARIDALIAEAEGMVAVAKERRSALITAAVTGQIDVLGEVA